MFLHHKPLTPINVLFQVCLLSLRCCVLLKANNNMVRYRNVFLFSFMIPVDCIILATENIIFTLWKEV